MTDRIQHCAGCKEWQDHIEKLEADNARLREASHMAMLELGSHGACPACFNAHSSLRDAFTKPGD